VSEFGINFGLYRLLWHTSPVKAGYEFLVGWRYTRSGKRGLKRNRFLSFISALSVAGIALGVGALIVVLSVMNGFQKEVRDKMLSVLSHIEVSSTEGSLANWQAIADRVATDPQVKASAPYVSGQAMVLQGDTMRGVVVRGVSPAQEPNVSDIGRHLRDGKLDDLVAGEFGAVIGIELARDLLINKGDKITLMVPQATVTPAGVVPRMKQFLVKGVFSSGHYEYDRGLVVLHMADAAKLYQVDTASGLRIKTADMQLAPETAQRLSAGLPGFLQVRDWSAENRNWFAAVQVEKRMMFIILTLIIAVAAFNLVSMLVMTVTDKNADIAILRTLGASSNSIRLIFMVQGALIGWLGTLAGVVLGCVIGANVGSIVGFVERVFGIHFLPPGIYFINYLPSDLQMSDVLRIALTAFVLSLLATIYPSWRASKVNPAEALRYE
jgi:lipoprotein-releasing system permease protein